MLASVLRFGPDVAVVSEGTHWFLLTLLAAAGVRVVPSLHVRLAPPGRPERWVQRTIRRLDRAFFRNTCPAVLAASAEIEGDLAEGVQDRPASLRFHPLYRKATFAGIKPACHEQRPFNVLYVGRLEANKGIFDFLEIAKKTCAARWDVHFHVCGIGSAMDELRSRVQAAGLGHRFALHGYCDRDQLARAYGEAHVVVVPTRSEIAEGFNQVVVEAVLAGRPVIASSLCPAVAYAGEAALVVPPDGADAYVEALRRLLDDAQFYHRMQRACTIVQERFYDPSLSWGVVLGRVLRMVLRGQVEEATKPAPQPCSRGAGEGS